MDENPEALLDVAERGVRRAVAAGGTEAEVYLFRSEGMLVESRGQLGNSQEAHEGGVCVRVALGRRVGSASWAGLTDASVARAVDVALDTARRLPENPRFHHFADPADRLPPPTRVSDAVMHPDVDRLLADVHGAADALRDVPDVSYATVGLESVTSEFAVANSRGVAAWDRDAREHIQLELKVRGRGVEKTGIDAAASREPISKTMDVSAWARAAADRARAGLDARPLDGVVRDVVFDEMATAQVLRSFLAALSGASAKSGVNPLSGKVGEAVASPLFSLTDVPHGPVGAVHQRVDDEGVPTRKFPLVEKGTLKGFLYNSFIAHADGVESTGHGMRALERRWTGTPKIRTINVDVAPGSRSLDDMVADADRAVFVRDHLMGYFTANSVTGDFSFVAPLAFLVERGCVAHALPPTTIAGNVHEMLKDLKAVSRERRTLTKGVFPAMHVGSLTCAT